jgi:putative methyltransferase (TIGR04325 family)
MKRLLTGRIERWLIVETRAMAAAGKRLTNESGLSFHCDCESAKSLLDRQDLVIAQGVLQYAPDPLQMLTGLFRLGFSYVYVTRTVVAVAGNATIDRPIFTRQETDLSAHGPGDLPIDLTDGKSSQPLTIVSLKSVSSAIPAAYDLLYWFDESDDRVLSIGGRLVRVRDIGFLAKKS